MSEKYNKKCKYLNYVEHLLILDSTVIGCISVSAFASLVAISVAITISAEGLKTSVITAGMKEYKSIIKKKRKMIK